MPLGLKSNILVKISLKYKNRSNIGIMEVTTWQCAFCCFSKMIKKLHRKNYVTSCQISIPKKDGAELLLKRQKSKFI
jgi:hypothetical protein